MIKVCFILGTFNIGGAENLVLNILRKLDLRKFNPSIVVFNGSGKLSGEYQGLGLKIIDLDFNRSRLRSFVKLLDLLRYGKFDCVHIHLTGIFFPAISAAKLAGVKRIIIHWHNVYRYYPFKLSNIKSNFIIWAILKYSSFFAEKIIAISRSVKENNCKEFKINDRKVEVVYNGVDITRISKIDSENSREMVLGTIGNVSSQKGLDILIRAINKLRDTYPGVKVEIVGSIQNRGDASEYYKSLEVLINKLSVQRNICFIGSLAPEETIKRLKSWNIFVLPSRWEGFGLVLIEAMAAKVPVIASNVNAIPEIISNEVTGLTFTLEDHFELAEKLSYLISNPDICKKFAAKAYMTAQKTFSIENTVKQLEKIYSNDIQI